jgi:transcriptional regulator with GAF, ATPase, and Fis domain
VSCLRNSLTKSSDTGEDLISGFGPDKGLGIVVSEFDILFDGLFQFQRAAVSRSFDLQTILQAVIDKIIAIFQFETTRIFLFNAEMEQMELRASFEVDPEHWTEVHTFKRGQGVIGRVVESGEPMIFENIETDPRYAALSTSRATKNAKLRFFAVLPIKTQSCIFGAIIFNSKSPRKLSTRSDPPAHFYGRASGRCSREGKLIRRG